MLQNWSRNSFASQHVFFLFCKAETSVISSEVVFLHLWWIDLRHNDCTPPFLSHPPSFPPTQEAMPAPRTTAAAVTCACHTQVGSPACVPRTTCLPMTLHVCPSSSAQGAARPAGMERACPAPNSVTGCLIVQTAQMRKTVSAFVSVYVCVCV